MRKILILLFFSTCCFVAYPQDLSEAKPPVNDRNKGLEVSAGYSVALGSYASFDKQNKKSGYATGGWQVQITFDWMGKKYFGLALQYTFQRNPMKNAATLVFPNGIPDSVNPGSWSNNYLMAGPVFMKRINRLQIDAKVLGGVLFSSGASFNTPDPVTSGKSNINVATGFAYQISAGVGYTISSHLALKLNVNFLNGWPGKTRQYGSQLIGYEEYKDPLTGIEYTRPVYSAPIEYEIKKVVTTLNPSLGLVYRF
ncbi:MAG: outer membrane beta-barrel protein [Bacteroidales bacterium]|nr:outer membrane beta-barrel protein [Bacteroidales bacterium]